MRNISNNLENEIEDLRETIIKEVGLQLANLTDELNTLKQKQTELIDLGDNHDKVLEILKINLFAQYVNYADSIRIESVQGLTNKSLVMMNDFIINPDDYKRRVTDRMQDTLTLKLHPIDGNLNKV